MLRRRTRQLVAAALSLFIVILANPAMAKKKDDLPGFTKYTLFRKGKLQGTFAYKTVTAESGTIYTSTRMELKTRGGGNLAVRTHTEKQASGIVTKYKKWIGNKGARPALIAFWQKDELRVVSKGSKRFTKDTKPGEGFVLLDHYGFQLYVEIAARWKKEGVTTLPAVLVHKGKTATISLSEAGTATLKNAAGEEVTATRLHLKTEGFDLEILVGDKPIFFGMRSKTMLAVREGWTLLSVQEKSETPVLEEGEEVAPETVEKMEDSDGGDEPKEISPVKMEDSDGGDEAKEVSPKEDAVETTPKEEKKIEKALPELPE